MRFINRIQSQGKLSHVGDLIYDHPISCLNYAHPSLCDINSDEVHRRIPKITNNSNDGSVYVVFNTSDFNANSKWTIHLDEITVNGEKITSPPLEFCYHPTKTE
ncbi:hypothetical protein [Proteus terrae]|uniref:hypothetical protein n=1 Tax=Proteus terrae TaxID=1574161 RepID=UPI0018E84FE5|nr:hypothetical protein [Proteus terrae]MBJ2134279.1 hypothetical protein [Proteus terrae]